MFNLFNRKKIDLKKPVFPSFLVGTIFAYTGIERVDLHNKGSSLNINEIHTELLFSKLLEHIVKGEQKQAEAILKKNPGFLLKTGTVIDYSQRIIQGTPFQCALGADDNEMYEMIVGYFDKIPNSKKEALKQFNEQFPDSKDVAPSYNFHNLYEKLGTEGSEKALERFRQDFSPKDIIKKGKHFNFQLLLDVFIEYERCFNDVKNFEQLSLFWREVVGYVLRFSPACVAQKLCEGFVHQGFFKTEYRQGKLKRSLKLLNDSLEEDGRTFYPLDSNPKYRLGFEFGLDLMGGDRATIRESTGGLPTACFLMELYKKKLTAIDRLKKTLNEPDHTDGFYLAKAVK